MQLRRHAERHRDVGIGEFQHLGELRVAEVRHRDLHRLKSLLERIGVPPTLAPVVCSFQRSRNALTWSLSSVQIGRQHETRLRLVLIKCELLLTN